MVGEIVLRTSKIYVDYYHKLVRTAYRMLTLFFQNVVTDEMLMFLENRLLDLIT